MRYFTYKNEIIFGHATSLILKKTKLRRVESIPFTFFKKDEMKKVLQKRLFDLYFVILLVIISI